ncbi:Uma2 family endonuclease [Methylobacterium sp. J-090]|uniref:Uma2 family endonuclease n=1 Tax=Methylobacterium sp. J-090 TaxID=2836666 RepID=UPI001FBADF2E|nr:Uma2 family endonuclease [Methylobacterium sp. J-090]MCJ2083621.1 Uma2 family endonuclease [Methylobacterium sp. J-090]
MAVAARRETRMSVAEYRLWVEDRPDCERWELIDGEPLLMSPPRERHQAIVARIIRQLGDLADRKGCRALPGLAVLSAAMDDFAPIPDAVVRCGPLLPDGYSSDPILVAEVLSPSTMSLDRGRKTDFYRSVPSLHRFLLVSQDEVRIEVWRRAAEGWDIDILYGDGVLDLPELGGSVAVRDLYTDIVF